MIIKKFKITNASGIHARPATALVNACMQFNSRITLEVLKKEVDMKSIMGVLSLGVNSGSLISIVIDGADEDLAMERITSKIYELNLGKEI